MTRLSGGPEALIKALVKRLPDDAIKLSQTVTALEEAADGLNVISNGESFFAKRVVLSVPMRVAAERIKMPEACSELVSHMARVPTWMANQCKVVIEYQDAFWREAGLSGRVASQVGPMVEIHDHCSELSGRSALFGFVGIPFEQRDKYRDALEQAILEQLERCFGPKGRDVSKIILEDWGLNQDICSEKDRTEAGSHPEVLGGGLRDFHLDGRLLLAVAELAEESPGLIDGALMIGEQAGKRIVDDV
jgi:monoamine oxidase